MPAVVDIRVLGAVIKQMPKATVSLVMPFYPAVPMEQRNFHQMNFREVVYSGFLLNLVEVLSF
jgi:hypothetical protein